MHSHPQGCGDLHVGTVFYSSLSLASSAVLSLWKGLHKPLGSGMERILESRSVSPASPRICIREVEKKRPRRSEVTDTENSVPYLVG